MRAVNRAVLASLAAIAFSTASVAQEAGDGWQFYYSAGIPITNLETSGLVAAAASQGVVIGDEAGDLTVGGQGTLGLMVNRYFGAEVRYGASGNSRDDPTITNLTQPPLRGTVKTSIDGITVYGVGRWPLSDQIDLLGKLGFTFQDLDLEADLAGTLLDLGDDDEGLAGALGVRLRTAGNWAVTAELEYFAVDFDDALDEPFRGSLNLEYTF